MATFYDRYSQAKADFDKCKPLFPASMLANLNKGASIGPALKTFDKADGFEGRLKAMMAVRTAKQLYDREIKTALNVVQKKDSPAYKALDRLEKNLLSIVIDADKEAQPPRPGGGTVPYEVLRGFNLANGFKPKFLDVKATSVTVVIEVDKTLDQLIKNGQESLKINHLGDVAKAEVEKLGDAFSKTMQTVDAKVEGLDAKGRAEKVKEANEVLKHYAKIVEDRVNTAIEKEWQGYLSRKKYLSEFRLKCVLKITLGVVGVGVAAASIGLTLGAMWQNIFALVKGIVSIADTIKTWSQDIDKVYRQLCKEAADINKLNLQREAAKKAGAGQKASKAAQAGKEVLVALLPITKSMVRTASGMEDRAKQFLGLVSKIEDQADKLSGVLRKTIDAMSGLPDKQMNAAMKADADKMDQTLRKLFEEITDLHRKSQNAAKFGERALATAQKLVKEDYWAGVSGDATNLGSRGVSVYSLANFAVQVAKHGSTIISQL